MSKQNQQTFVVRAKYKYQLGIINDSREALNIKTKWLSRLYKKPAVRTWSTLLDMPKALIIYTLFPLLRPSPEQSLRFAPVLRILVLTNSIRLRV
jgi:hypothetical protein